MRVRGPGPSRQHDRRSPRHAGLADRVEVSHVYRRPAASIASIASILVSDFVVCHQAQHKGMRASFASWNTARTMGVGYRRGWFGGSNIPTWPSRSLRLRLPSNPSPFSTQAHENTEHELREFRQRTKRNKFTKRNQKRVFGTLCPYGTGNQINAFEINSTILCYNRLANFQRIIPRFIKWF